MEDLPKKTEITHTIAKHPEIHACVLTAHGDMDLAVVPEIRAELQDVIDTGFIYIVMDLSDVGYVDSSALGLLVWLDHELAGTEGRVVLTGADENVSRILEISGLISVAGSVRTSDTVEDALRGLDIPVNTGSPMWAQEMTMPADVRALSAVRERASSMMMALGFSDAALFDIKVALGEALANAVRHGSPAGGDAAVSVNVRAFEDRVEIDVTDSGTGFDGAHPGAEDLYASGGRGIMFMRALMDDVRFSSASGGGTVVTLVKHRP